MAGFDLDNMKTANLIGARVDFGQVTFTTTSLTATVVTTLSYVFAGFGILETESSPLGKDNPVATITAGAVSGGNVTLTRQTADSSTTPTYNVVLIGY